MKTTEISGFLNSCDWPSVNHSPFWFWFADLNKMVGDLSLKTCTCHSAQHLVSIILY